MGCYCILLVIAMGILKRLEVPHEQGLTNRELFLTVSGVVMIDFAPRNPLDVE